MAAGIRWWGVYVGGPNAYHIWTPQEVQVLREAKLPGALPIWVPTYGMTEDPTIAADSAIAAAQVRGLDGVIVLDTEAKSRGVPRLEPFTSAFYARIRARGWRSVNYFGAEAPGGDALWNPNWANEPAGPPPGGAVQFGQRDFGGLTVDVDEAAPGFPVVNLNPPPIPKTLPAPIAGAAETHTGAGYWLVDERGNIYCYGDAPHLGDLAGQSLPHPVVTLISSPTSYGYTMVTSAGRVLNFGEAWYGSPAATQHLEPATPGSVPVGWPMS